jgi:hypothetical protein
MSDLLRCDASYGPNLNTLGQLVQRHEEVLVVARGGSEWAVQNQGRIRQSATMEELPSGSESGRAIAWRRTSTLCTAGLGPTR